MGQVIEGKLPPPPFFFLTHSYCHCLSQTCFLNLLNRLPTVLCGPNTAVSAPVKANRKSSVPSALAFGVCEKVAAELRGEPVRTTDLGFFSPHCLLFCFISLFFDTHRSKAGEGGSLPYPTPYPNPSAVAPLCSYLHVNQEEKKKAQQTRMRVSSFPSFPLSPAPFE